MESNILTILKDQIICFVHYEDANKNIFRRRSYNLQVLNEKKLEGFSTSLGEEQICFHACNFKIKGRFLTADIEIFDNHDGRLFNVLLKQFEIIFRPLGCKNRLGNSKEIISFAISKIVAMSKYKDTWIEPKEYIDYDEFNETN